MKKLIVDTYDDGGIQKYAIYHGQKEPSKVLTENWQPALYDTEEDANFKLEAIKAEYYRECSAVPFSLEDAKRYAESHYWKYASTYAKTAPHEYCVKRWLVEEDQLLYERFVSTMKAKSVIGYFYGHENKYLILGDHYYWYMPLPDEMAVDLINRTTTDYLEFREGAYYYKPHSN